jgi:hypothetical protein
MAYYERHREELLDYQKLYYNIHYDAYQEYQRQYYLKRKSDPERYKQICEANKKYYEKKTHNKRMKKQITRQKKLKQKLLAEIIRKTVLIENTITIVLEPKKIKEDIFKGYKMTNKGNYYLEW